MKKFVLITLLLIGGLGAWAYASRNGSEGTDAGARYRSEAIRRGPIVATVSATGTVTPTTTVIVGSQLSGQVVEILADFNSEVKAGQVLARLNKDTLNSRRDAARADLAQARAARQLSDAQVEKTRAEIRRAEAMLADVEAQAQRAAVMLADAEATYERQNSLKARGIATEVTLQSAETQRSAQLAAKRSAEAQISSSRAQITSLEADLKVIEAQKLSGDAVIARMEAQVRQIEVDLSNTDIKAPVDGVVVQRNVELGRTVAASLQAPELFLVAQDLRLIEIYVNVDEADVGRVKVGQEVDFSVNAYPGRDFKGRVKQIRLGSQTVQNVVIYTTVVEVRNDDRALLPGMTANLRIFTEKRDDVLRVPNAALRWQPPGARAQVAGAEGAAAGEETPGGREGRRAGGGPGAGQRGGGGGAAMLEGLKTALALTPEQVAEVEKLSQAMRGSFRAGGDDPSARREAMQAARENFTRGVEAVLTPEQREKYAAMRETRRDARAAAGVPGRVFVLDGAGAPRQVALRLGASDGSHTEVISGEIKPGDTVVTGTIASPKAAGATGGGGRGMRFGF
jgi:HlyD family secretion protein